jgi:hypothetical protein
MKILKENSPPSTRLQNIWPNKKKNQSMTATFYLKFVIIVTGGHCVYWNRAPRRILATPLHIMPHLKNMKIAVSCEVTPCSLLQIYRYFGGFSMCPESCS